jgi:hypothetical protein
VTIKSRIRVGRAIGQEEIIPNNIENRFVRRLEFIHRQSEVNKEGVNNRVHKGVFIGKNKKQTMREGGSPELIENDSELSDPLGKDIKSRTSLRTEVMVRRSNHVCESVARTGSRIEGSFVGGHNGVLLRTSRRSW